MAEPVKMIELGDVLAMGGYAPFIWSGYGLTLLILLACFAVTLYRRRTLQRRFENIQGAEDRTTAEDDTV